MGNKNIQTTYVFAGRKSKAGKKSDSTIKKILVGVTIGLLVLWISSQLNIRDYSAIPGNSKQEQNEKG